MPRVFIVFRQYDSDRIAYRLDEHLRLVFGAASVAISSRLAPGKDARLEIAHYINASNLVLVVIGRRWLSDANLFDPRDPVHLAVRTALELPDKAVIPLLVEGAVMPDAAQLPPGLQPLAYRTAINIHDDPDFNIDASRLVTAIQRIETERVANNPPPQIQTPARSASRQPRPAPVQQPSARRPSGSNPLAGIVKFGGRVIARIVGFFGSLIQVVIHQMLRSTVALAMNILLILLIVGLAMLYISALLNNGLNFGLAFRAVLDQIGGFIGGLLGG